MIREPIVRGQTLRMGWEPLCGMGLGLLVAVACVAHSALPRDTRSAEIIEAEVREFLHALDSAVLGADWEEVKAAFDRDVKIEIVGPPPGLRLASITRARMLEAFQRDARMPGYTRGRSIDAVEIDFNRSVATARSVVAEGHLDDQQQEVWLQFVEIAVVQIGEPEMTIVNYYGEVLAFHLAE